MNRSNKETEGEELRLDIRVSMEMEAVFLFPQEPSKHL